MANENVKVIIQEDNQTEPKGSGISSDIVYVPGFAVDNWSVKNKDGSLSQKQVTKIDAQGNIVYDKITGKAQTTDWTPVRGVPKLCTNTAQFESYFGPKPYQLTEADIAEINKNIPELETIYQKGDYDKSYIYAKELLNAGLSVIYSDISSEVVAGTAMPAKLNPDVQNAAIEFTDDVLVYHAHTNAPTTDENGNVSITPVTDDSIIVSFNMSEYADTKYLNVPFTVEAEIVRSNNDPDFKCNIGDVTVYNSTNPKKSSDALTVTQSENSVSVKWAAADKISKNVNFMIPFSIKLPEGVSVDEIGNYTVTIKLVQIFEVTRELLESGEVSNSKFIDYTNRINEQLDLISDKSEYNVKYITSGAYPAFNSSTTTVADKMLEVASSRGDAVAIIDHFFDDTLTLNPVDEGSIYKQINEAYANNSTTATYGTMFTPWAVYSCPCVPTESNKTLQLMPASFGYLLCLAATIQTRPNWLAIAGVTRGIPSSIKQLATGTQVLTNTIAEEYQPKFGGDGTKISLNAITNIKPYGLTIWGNRTLHPVDPKGTTALNFLNTRNMISDIKKVSYDTARSLMFEQDSDVLWLRFKSKISPLLDRLKAGFGISNYKIIRNTTKYNGDPLTRGELSATIKIFPLYAIEYFEITVVIADEDVTVS